MEVGQVVDGPGGQQLRERNGAQRRVGSAQCELVRGQAKRIEFLERSRADARELIEQLRQALAAAGFHMSKAIEWVEGAALAKFQNPPRARQPVFAIGVDEVPDDAERGPRISALAAVRPLLRQIAQKCIQSGRGTRQQSDGLRKIVFQGAPRGVRPAS